MNNQAKVPDDVTADVPALELEPRTLLGLSHCGKFLAAQYEQC